MAAASAENPFELFILIWNFAVIFLSHMDSHTFLFTLLSFSSHLPKIKTNLTKHGYSYNGGIKAVKNQLNELCGVRSWGGVCVERPSSHAFPTPATIHPNF